MGKDDTKKEEMLGAVAIKPPGWDRTGLEAFRYFLYDPDNGTILSRTPKSWALITIFYCIYYSCLAAFWYVCLLIFFLAEMTLLALSFIYPNKLTEFLDDELSEKLIQSYRDDLDFQNIIDLVQQDFECCGISSEGYKDWSKNEYFNCTTNKEDNPSVERCGVPYSCCHQDDPAVLINYMCGFQVGPREE